MAVDRKTEQSAAEMRMMRWMIGGVTGGDEIRNEYIIGSMGEWLR